MISKNVSRRDFVRFSAAGTAVAALGMYGCAPATSSLADSGNELAAMRNSADVEWTEEADVVVVGSGCALFGAMLASKAGKKAIVLEKGSKIGGTLFYSMFGMWVPNNHLMGTVDWATKDSEEAAVAYMKACDANLTAIEGQVEEWVKRVPEVFRYLNEDMGFPIAVAQQNDYYAYEGHAIGRSLHPDYGDSEDAYSYEGNLRIVEPMVEEYGLDIRLETPASHLVQDESGAVVGVIAADGKGNEIAIKANAGVLLGAGSFDHNEALRRAFLTTPMAGSWMVEENTGDGIVMGLEVGADLNHMYSVFGDLAYITGGDGLTYGGQASWDLASPNTMAVNRAGRRFFSESYDYCQLMTNQRALDFSTVPPTPNSEVFVIADSRFVQDFGYPGTGGDAENLPSFIHRYDTLEALAEGEGIDKEGFLAQVERFNGFCETGVDEEFHRGESPYEDPEFGGGSFGLTDRDDLANPYLGPISTPPFFVGKVGPGSYGTSGGLLTDMEYRVIKNGEPIPGLYACGCNAGSIIDSHPGYGGSISVAMAGGMFAVNHMFDLGLF